MADWISISLTSAVIAGFVSSGITVTANYFLGERSRQKERMFQEKKRVYINTLTILNLVRHSDVNIISDKEYAEIVASIVLFSSRTLQPLNSSLLRNPDAGKEQITDIFEKIVTLMREDLGIKD